VECYGNQVVMVGLGSKKMALLLPCRYLADGEVYCNDILSPEIVRCSELSLLWLRAAFWFRKKAWTWRSVAESLSLMARVAFLPLSFTRPFAALQRVDSAV
jgi:hypothetical protein